MREKNSVVEWFEDLAVGMRFKSPEKGVTREEIIRFASEFDLQPYHLDEAAAEQTPLKGLAASGWLKRTVAELKAPIAEKLEITLSLLIERADMIFRQAMSAGQFNAACSALKELGVLSGKRVERSERGEPGEFDRM